MDSTRNSNYIFGPWPTPALTPLNATANRWSRQGAKRTARQRAGRMHRCGRTDIMRCSVRAPPRAWATGVRRPVLATGATHPAARHTSANGADPCRGPRRGRRSDGPMIHSHGLQPTRLRWGERDPADDCTFERGDRWRSAAPPRQLGLHYADGGAPRCSALISGATMSIGSGKTIVEFLSAAMTVSVSR
jgi:hypothetical protein